MTLDLLQLVIEMRGAQRKIRSYKRKHEPAPLDLRLKAKTLETRVDMRINKINKHLKQ